MSLKTATTTESLAKLIKERAGMGWGTFSAMALSWLINHHVGWAFLHGLCGWGYVIYYALGFAGVIPAEALK